MKVNTRNLKEIFMWFLPKLKQMVRFRNRLVHMYWEIDAEIIYDEILQDDLGDFDTFVKHILSNFEIQ